jgi:hypothetical protein
VGSQQLTAWAMARPYVNVILYTAIPHQPQVPSSQRISIVRIYLYLYKVLPTTVFGYMNPRVSFVYLWKPMAFHTRRSTLPLPLLWWHPKPVLEIPNFHFFRYFCDTFLCFKF